MKHSQVKKKKFLLACVQASAIQGRLEPRAVEELLSDIKDVTFPYSGGTCTPSNPQAAPHGSLLQKHPSPAAATAQRQGLEQTSFRAALGIPGPLGNREARFW